jgi:hypothetical protein
MPATQAKFVERLKDDFIVRNPTNQVEPPTEITPPSHISVEPKPAAKEKPQLQLVAQREEPKPAPREEQTILPFNAEL